jgi:uncharacterized protein with PIN domain
MIQRQCPECDSELVLTRRADNQDGPGIVLGASTYWRCAVCGRMFKAEQLRKNKRAKVAATEQAEASVFRVSLGQKCESGLLAHGQLSSS